MIIKSSLKVENNNRGFIRYIADLYHAKT